MSHIFGEKEAALQQTALCEKQVQTSVTWFADYSHIYSN